MKWRRLLMDDYGLRPWAFSVSAVTLFAVVFSSMVMVLRRLDPPGARWQRECAKHRPLAECRVDWAEMDKQ